MITVEPKPTPVSGDVTKNDTLGDGDKSEHTFKKASDPLNGTVTVNPDGTYEYMPNKGFTGKDTFEYTIVDKDGDEDTTKVVITVEPKDPVIELVDKKPIADPDDNTTKEGTPVSGDVSQIKVSLVKIVLNTLSLIKTAMKTQQK